MDAQTWQRAKEWLVEAAALPESERAAYLAQRCPDAALRAELLEMLASDTTLSGIVGMSTLTRGTRLGPYEIETKIGEGGMGEVYRARDGRLGRDVAIKVIPTPFATDRERLARFEREAKLLASLNHPHICTLFDVGREADTEYIVMEYVDGELLSDRLRKGPLPTNKALAYAIEIADALDKAHAVGIVHRDLKPGNVMVAKSGTKLLDFGLARRTHALSRDVTKTGTVLGTLRYMAPEQLRGGDADTRTDVWAFGCVLYQMLTGRAPFDSPSETATGAAILETEPPPLSSVVPGISPALQRVVDRCLAKAPDDRWQSVADLRHELSWIARGRTSDERAPVRASRAVTSWRARIAWAAAVVSVIAIAALAINSWNAGRGSLAELARLSILLPDGIDEAHFLALSNDGQQLAYVGRSREGNDSLIWVREMGEVDARSLAGTAGRPIFPFWNPSGRELGFFADGKLKVVDVKSGTIRELCPAPNGRGGTWTEHTILFVPDQHDAVHRVSDRGGEATPVTQRQPNELHRFPRFLADGVHFLFTVEDTASNVVSIAVGSLADGRVSALSYVKSGNRPSEGATTQAYVANGMLVFGRGGAVLAQQLDERNWQLSGEPIVVVPQGVGGDLSSGAFSVSNNAVVYRPEPPRVVSQLTWIPRGGAVATPIWTPGPFQVVQLSTDDSRAIVARSNGSQLVFYLMSLMRPDVNPQPLGEGSASPIVLSQDGTRVFYRKSAGSKLYDNPIYSFRVDGGVGIDERLEEDQPSGNKYPLGWSESGSLLYAVNMTGTRSDLWEKPTSGAAHPLISSVEDASVDFIDAAFTPTGNLIASAVNGTLYVQPIRHGSRITVANSKSLYPRWRADGRELFYVNNGSLMAVEITAGDPIRVGTPQRLFELSDAKDVRYWPTRDGQRFLVAVPLVSTVPSQVGVVLNWPRLVGK